MPTLAYKGNCTPVVIREHLTSLLDKRLCDIIGPDWLKAQKAKFDDIPVVSAFKEIHEVAGKEVETSEEKLTSVQDQLSAVEEKDVKDLTADEKANVPKTRQHVHLLQDMIYGLRKSLFDCLAPMVVFFLAQRFNPWVLVFYLFGEEPVHKIIWSMFAVSASLTSFGPNKAFDLLKGNVGRGKGTILRVSNEGAELIKTSVPHFETAVGWAQLLTGMSVTKNALMGMVPEATTHLPNDQGWSLLSFAFKDEMLKASLFASSVSCPCAVERPPERRA